MHPMCPAKAEAEEVCHVAQSPRNEDNEMEVLTTEGRMSNVEIDDARERSLVGEHWSAIGHYRDTGDVSRLDALRGRSVAGLPPLEFDPDEIDEWARLGELDIESPYTEPTLMTTTPNDRCVICGQPATDDHHYAGRANLPGSTAATCEPDHDERNAELWRAGVPLAHARNVSEAEVGYATVVGVSSMSRAIIGALAMDTTKQVDSLDEASNALLRHVLLTQPPDARTFGPQPLAEAGREPLEQRSRGVVPVDDLPVQITGLLAMLAEAAQTILGEHEQNGGYVAAMTVAARVTPAALERLATLSSGREPEWLAFDEFTRARLTAFSRAVTYLHPFEPTAEQVAAVAAALHPLERVERELFGLLAALGDDRTDEQATAALDRFFAACEAR